MARIARVVVPHFPHHVTQRGARRLRTFFRDEDYRLYHDLLRHFCEKAGTRVWAYCLMPNHVHLVVVPSHSEGLGRSIGEVHRRYAWYVNRREGWRGHLWQERFYSAPMDEQYLLAAVRYVERNPVEAELCERPGEWPWSSAPAHLGVSEDALLDQGKMRALVSDWEAYLADAVHERLRATIESHARSGRPLGGAEFVRSIERISGRTLVGRRRGRRPKGGEK